MNKTKDSIRMGEGAELVAHGVSLQDLFTSCSPDQAEEFYTPERRSVRIHGHSTTIRLERAYWNVLDRFAEREGVTTAGLITKVHDHCQFSDQKNLASCLRVLALKYVGG